MSETGGPFFMDLAGLELQGDEAEWLAHPWVGGVILFGRNCADPKQIAALTAAIRQVRPELVIAVDQEGGRVQRLRQGFTRLPAAARLGELYERDACQALELAEGCGRQLALELGAVDIDFSFAPVLDLDRDRCPAIGDRAFSDDPEVAVAVAEAVIVGLEAGGAVSCAKHFPGHGGVTEDSHIAAPVDPRGMAELRAHDLKPFAALLPRCAAVMPAHVRFPAVDSEPVGFSRYWLQTVLRQELQFHGLIFSDDLAMVAAHAAGDPAQRARAALAAGCDVLLLCNRPQELRAAITELAKEGAPPKPRLSSLKRRRPVAFSELAELVASPLAQRLTALT